MTEISRKYGHVLVVDDEPNARKVLSAILSEEGYRVSESYNARSAIDLINRENIDTIITDLKMTGGDGMQLFDYVVKNRPEIPVIFLTAYGTVESAVQAITRGAFYYFIKPPDYMKLKGIISRAVEQRRLKLELEILKKKLTKSDNRRLIGKTPEIFKLLDIIKSVKDSGSSVLIYGETGTGKELAARLLHGESNRKEFPFVAVNCAAIPHDLLESELFGYEKGAFTGASFSRTGRIEEAAGGTLFLDEIGEMDMPLQAKLLRVLQEREIERLGSSRKIRVDFRLLSSTNRELAKDVQEGKFREDLYYRINVVEIKMPPLRERRDDIPLLTAEFLNEFCAKENKTIRFSDEVMQTFQKYHWPGNIRQLRNIIERAVVLSQKELVTPRELPEDFIHLKRRAGMLTQVKTLKELEIQAIRNALAQCRGNKSRAAKMLGISRKAFYKKLMDT